MCVGCLSLLNICIIYGFVGMSVDIKDIGMGMGMGMGIGIDIHLWNTF